MRCGRISGGGAGYYDILPPVLTGEYVGHPPVSSYVFDVCCSIGAIGVGYIIWGCMAMGGGIDSRATGVLYNSDGPGSLLWS